MNNSQNVCKKNLELLKNLDCMLLSPNLKEQCHSANVLHVDYCNEDRCCILQLSSATPCIVSPPGGVGWHQPLNVFARCCTTRESGGNDIKT